MADAGLGQRLCFILLILTSGILFTGQARASNGYELGQGYNVGSFNFAGYSNVTAEFPVGGQNSLAVEDLSLFVTGHLSRWINPFAEAELTHVALARGGGRNHDNTGSSLVFERIYNDAYLSDSLTARLGKMLAPVGAWNLNHAAPLVMSVTRPAVTYKNFAAYIGGASLLFSDPKAVYPDVQLYWQPDWEESEKARDVSFEQHKMTEGVHVVFPLMQLDQIGISFQRTTDIQNVSQSLIGVDFRYSVKRLTLQGEATYSRLAPGGVVLTRDREAGGYVAADYVVAPGWSAYTWYETFLSRSAPSAAQDALVGVSYRPIDPMVLKLEYLQNFGGDPVNPSGVFASWSVLF